MAMVDSGLEKEETIDELAKRVEVQAKSTLDQIENFIGTLGPNEKNPALPENRSPDPLMQIRTHLRQSLSILNETQKLFADWARHIRA